MNKRIVNARIVNEGKITEGELVIEGERIKGINVPAPSDATVFDAAGAYLIPGMIDDQVHFREPGFEHKGNIRTEFGSGRRRNHQPHGNAQLQSPHHFSERLARQT